MTQDITAGAVLTICGGIFFFLFSADNKKHISKIKTIPAIRIKDIIHIGKVTKEEMGANGYLNMMVAVEGFIKESDHSKSGIFHVSEYNLKAEGLTKIRVKNNQFYIEDSGDQILIKTDQPVSFYDYKGKTIPKEHRATPYTEIIEHVKGPIYIVGEASDVSGEPVIQKPKDYTNPFVIAFASEKEYIQQKENVQKRAAITGILLILIGTIFLVVEILK
jgi:hypothetical protein